MVSNEFPIHSGQTWSQKVLAADDIWQQVKTALDNQGMELPKTPRRPDIRMIVKNTTGQTIQFLNPGDHSGQKQEFIPGDNPNKNAAMVMLGGNTLDEQYANAEALTRKYGLAENGLTKEFAIAMAAEAEAGVLLEAYGPAPFDGQADRLKPLQWGDSSIAPVVEGSVAYGARPPEMESVLRSELAIFVKGTGTTPEKMEMHGMCIAITSDWQTGAISTRPIAPSVAKDFYGEHFGKIPVVELDVEGNVASINLNNGQAKIYLDDPYAEQETPMFLRHASLEAGQPS